MWRLVLLIVGLIGLFNSAAAQDRFQEFIELANRAEVYDSDCIEHGGEPMEYDEKAWRRGRQEDNVIHTQDGIYVTYAYKSTKWLVIPTIGVKHCRFPQR